MFYIHRYWTGDDSPPVSSRMCGKIAAKFGDLVDWTDDSLPIEIVEVIAECDGLVPLSERPKQRANIARLCLLRQFGGTWIDHDIVLLQSINLATEWIATDDSQMCSAVMRFNQGNPLLDLALASVSQASTARASSGEAMLEKAWPDVQRRQLSFSFDGSRARTDMWAVHFWASRT